MRTTTILAAALLSAGLIAAQATTAQARGHHYRHHHYSHSRHHHYRHHARVAPPEFVAETPQSFVAGSASSVINKMRSWLGGNPTGWGHDWCGKALDIALRSTGHAPGSNLAKAYMHYGRPSGPKPGALVVWSRRGGGHVGVITQVLGHGRATVISGNDGHRVRERVRSIAGAIAFRSLG